MKGNGHVPALGLRNVWRAVSCASGALCRTPSEDSGVVFVVVCCPCVQSRSEGCRQNWKETARKSTQYQDLPRIRPLRMRHLRHFALAATCLPAG